MLNLALFLKILLISSLFGFLFCLLLFTDGVVFDTLSAELFFLLTHLPDPVDSGLLLEAVLEGDLVTP